MQRLPARLGDHIPDRAQLHQRIVDGRAGGVHSPTVLRLRRHPAERTARSGPFASVRCQSAGHHHELAGGSDTRPTRWPPGPRRATGDRPAHPGGGSWRSRGEPIPTEVPVEQEERPDTQGAPREWTATVNGTGLRVEEAGPGAAVVFSPALFTNRGLFDAPFAALSGDYRCVRYDHRGQGDSGLGAVSRRGTCWDRGALRRRRRAARPARRRALPLGGGVGRRVRRCPPRGTTPERVRSLILIGFST